jgi:hypothetical protein
MSESNETPVAADSWEFAENFLNGKGQSIADPAAKLYALAIQAGANAETVIKSKDASPSIFINIVYPESIADWVGMPSTEDWLADEADHGA